MKDLGLLTDAQVSKKIHVLEKQMCALNAASVLTIDSYEAASVYNYEYPRFVVISNDESTGGQNVLYFWDGSELTIVDSGSPLRVATFATMISLLVENRPMNFVVIQDEYQETLPPYLPEENVPYMWDGVILFEYNSSPCDFQPTF